MSDRSIVLSAIIVLAVYYGIVGFALWLVSQVSIPVAAVFAALFVAYNIYKLNESLKRNPDGELDKALKRMLQ